LYYDCSWQLSNFVWSVLTEWSLHTHSEHWQHFQSVLLSLAVGQIEHLPCHCLCLSSHLYAKLVVFKGHPLLLVPCSMSVDVSHYRPSFICVVIPFLLPEKADTYFYDSSSFVVNWDISASTVQMHLHKQQQSN